MTDVETIERAILEYAEARGVNASGWETTRHVPGYVEATFVPIAQRLRKSGLIDGIENESPFGSSLPIQVLIGTLAAKGRTRLAELRKE